MKKENLAVVALSGGIDSCVTAAIAEIDYELALLHVNYGQRTEKRELKAFHDIANYYNVKHKLVIDFSHFSKIGSSSRTDKSIEVAKADLNSKDVPLSYVPFRNAHILSACVSWAEVLKAEVIFIGAVFEDASGYPDCKPEFFQAFEKAMVLGTKPETKIKIETPVIHLNKSEIISKGLVLHAPLELTWSCYTDEDLACGICDSCAFRLRGFQKLGIKDLIPYKEQPIYFQQGKI